MKYDKYYNTKSTPQRQPIPDREDDMVKMRSGGYAFKLNKWERLHRFLVLGSEGGSYYASERDLTVENAKSALNCVKEDGMRVVNMVYDVRMKPVMHQDASLYILAMVFGHGDLASRQQAEKIFNFVVRTGRQLFTFLSYVQSFRGWGSILKRTIQNWYLDKDINKLEYQMVKYRHSKEGNWTHRDVLRKCHAHWPNQVDHNALFHYATTGNWDGQFKLVVGYETAKQITPTATASDIAKLIEEFNLPREAVPTQFLKSPEVWAALLKNMPFTAMIRNLGNMAAAGLHEAFSDTLDYTVDRIKDMNLIKRSRVHPMQILFAMRTYESGSGFRGHNSWPVNQRVVDALEQAYYVAFDNVEPTNQTILIGVDTSGSMAGSWRSEVMTPLEFAAANVMAILHAENSDNIHVLGVDTQVHDVSISERKRLTDVTNTFKSYCGGGTNTAQLIEYAIDHRIVVDNIIIFSDGESWAGNRHTSQLMEAYRKISPNAKLICVDFVANAYTQADPDDSLAFKVVGNDASLTQAVNAIMQL